MTTRPGSGTADRLRYTRTKRLCTLTRVVRRDGVELCFTDHDRKLHFEGREFVPVVLGDLSADRREAALRSGDQEARGFIDGTLVTIPDINGNAYLGAEVFQVVTDWTMPWHVVGRHRRWIRKVVRRGSTWIATLEGRSQVLQRQAAGRFGGTWTTVCPYKLGGGFCRKDISAWTQVAPSESGTSGTAGTSVTLTDVSKSWTTDEWVGYRLVMRGGGTGSGQERTIVGNTADTLTLDRAWVTAPSACAYQIGDGVPIATVYDDRNYFQVAGFYFTGGWVDDWYRDGEIEWTTGDNVGTTSAIVGYEDATVKFRLLIPTPYPIQVGDKGIIRVGCDGLFTTCKDKFANQINFGGDHEAPSAAQVIEQPEER